MLLHQGAAAFTLWTGQPAPVELMREKLEAGLAGGRGATAAGPRPRGRHGRVEPAGRRAR